MLAILRNTQYAIRNTPPMPTLLTLVPNLLYGVAISNAAQGAGLRVVACRSMSAFQDALLAAEAPVGAVVDLGGGSGGAWDGAIRIAAAAHVPVFAFGPHLDSTTLKAARRAGAARVVANSALAAELPKWLAQRHGPTPSALEETPTDDHA